MSIAAVPLFSLPVEVGALVCLEWLRMKSLATLDAACASRHSRSALRQMFATNGFLVSIGEVYFNYAEWYISCLKWLIKRGLSVRTLVVDSKVCEQFPLEDLEIACHSAQEIFVNKLDMNLTIGNICAANKMTKLRLRSVFGKFDQTVSLPQLEELTFECCDVIRLENCQNLTALSLLSMKPDRVMEIISQLFHIGQRPMLNSLSLEGVRDMSDEQVDDTLARCPMLTNLSIKNCQRKEGTFGQIAQHCHNVQTLQILGCSGTSDASVHQNLHSFASKCRSLVSLHISGNYYVDKIEIITDATLSLILVHMPALTELALDYCSGLLGAVSLPPCTVTGTPSALRKLSFTVCTKLKSLMNIFTLCPALEDLVILGAPLLSIAARNYLFLNGTSLASLELTPEWIIGLNGLEEIPSDNLPKLRKLNIRERASKPMLDPILRICHNLEDINLSCASPGPQMDSYRQLAERYSASLTSLRVRAATEPIDVFLPVVTLCQRLQSLELWSPMIGCAPFYDAVARLPTLRYLFISSEKWSDKATFEGFVRALNGCSSLRTVHLQMLKYAFVYTKEHDLAREFGKALKAAFPDRTITMDVK